MSHNDIELKAYYLWENAGKPEGRSLDFWLMAEEDFKYPLIIWHFNEDSVVTLVGNTKHWSEA